MILRFTEINEISKRDLITLTESQLRNIEIRAFWAGLSQSPIRYEAKIQMIADFYHIAPDTVKNIIPGVTTIIGG